MNQFRVLLYTCGFFAMAVQAQLVVSVSPAKVEGQSAVVPLEFKNDFNQRVDSARAVVFLSDQQGKMVAQSTKWVIGGTQNKPGLAPGATNSFFFVLTADKPFPGTNLSAKVSFSRVVLEDGKLANPVKDVMVLTNSPDLKEHAK